MHRTNYNIKSSSVRVFKEQQSLGILPIDQAIKIAFDENLTLVELVPNAKPPVCHIMDYGKYLYEEKIKEKEKARKQRESVTLVKDIRLSPVISEHDIETKFNCII